MAITITAYTPSAHVAAAQPKSYQASAPSSKSTIATPSVHVAAIQPKVNQADAPLLQSSINTPNTPSAQVATMQFKPGQSGSPTLITSTSNAERKTDIIDLSPRARALMLRQQGRPIFEIAVIMNLDIKTVATFLGAVTEAIKATQTGTQDYHAQATSRQLSNISAVSAESSAKNNGVMF